MQVVAERFDYIPVALIDESPTNPRQHFHNMEDLIADVRQRRRIIQPLLLRPRGERYEVIAGARRLRAARAVELEKVPALISEMPDLEEDVKRLWGGENQKSTPQERAEPSESASDRKDGTEGMVSRAGLDETGRSKSQ